eukprot:CAMPEP_0201124466 /NCGR_PEP_ID=MMETSP0850-20130426/13776_1 /ASSEMBLY_ACC=CAM_ASM_000622 /TAXON_ID=183588 /ORGANISM="Pseudo-nitzschia fraudulenta, Strain WWA7" /LENGTH=218 /DNA_ID=CAMNT_0047391871 /DNA_START=348 /DNA_END=1005 /DNA_ORIENTATION=+
MMLVLVVNLNGVVCSSSRKRLFELLELDLAFFHALLGGNALVELDRSDHGLEAHAQQEELDCRFFGVESMVGEETDSEDHEPAEDLGVPDLEAHFLLLLEDHLGKVHEKVGRITENWAVRSELIVAALAAPDFLARRPAPTLLASNLAKRMEDAPTMSGSTMLRAKEFLRPLLFLLDDPSGVVAKPSTTTTEHESIETEKVTRIIRKDLKENIVVVVI